ncbi:MAG: phosphoglucosamine mutase [Acidobacteriota bacterium]
MPKFFGTDGIRAKAGEFPLAPRALFVLGRALGQLLNNRLQHTACALIGRDTRQSGEWIESALAAGLQAAGAEVTSVGVIPTPGIAYLTGVGNFDVGIVISASHNPYEDNGIKIFAPSGRKLPETDESIIEAELLTGKLDTDEPALALLEPSQPLVERYFSFLHDEIAAGISLIGIKLALDCANGAASAIAPHLFASLGAEVVTCGCTPDGRNINSQCGSLYMEKLQALVQQEQCQLGIAFDGDADRALFVDEQGRLVDGDGVLFIIADHYLRNNQLDPKTVVATVMSNMGLEVGLRDRGIELRRTAVGDKYVLDELLTCNGQLGGEQSGHIIFPKISLAGDGMITALQLLRVLVRQGQSLSILAGGFQSFPQILINIPVRNKPAFNTVPVIQAAVQDLESKLVNQGRLLLRYSGTENLARIMIEGRDQRFINEEAQHLADIIRQQLG